MPKNDPFESLRWLAEFRRGRVAVASLDADALRLLLYAHDAYLGRLNELQAYQPKLPEPHRTAVCNILANGKPTSGLPEEGHETESGRRAD